MLTISDQHTASGVSAVVASQGGPLTYVHKSVLTLATLRGAGCWHAVPRTRESMPSLGCQSRSDLHRLPRCLTPEG